MRIPWTYLTIIECLVLGSVGLSAQTKTQEVRANPSVVSIHPFTVQRGTAVSVTVRGSGLKGAAGVMAGDAPLRFTTEAVEPEPPLEGAVKSKSPMDLVRLRVEVGADAKPGRYPIRLVTPNGVSNALPLHVAEASITAEPAGGHDTPETAIQVPVVPSLYTGRLTRRGESDYYAFQAKAGQTITFELLSGLPQTASAGSAATIPNFDPSIAIYEAGHSWLDARRLQRIAHNDEPVWVFGKSTDAHLVHTFAKDGSYLLRVEAFAGQGGPDYSYQLKMLPGVAPQDLAPPLTAWDERGFTRTLASNRLNELAARGAGRQDQQTIETYRAAAVPAAEAPLFKLPGTLQGNLPQPGETHRARFALDGPRDLAIELETPDEAPPFFNPIVRLLNASGEEVATNLFAGKGACNGALTKSLQAKVTVPLREAGTYTLEIRDATADLAGEKFRYRLQVRPQVPHVGKVSIETDHVNLAPDEAKAVRVIFDREEDFRGALAVMTESLPAGVQAVVGADYEPETDPPSTIGKRDRYTPRTERTVLMLTAAADATPMATPQMARIVVRPVANGKMGDVIATKLIPIMVIARQ